MSQEVWEGLGCLLQEGAMEDRAGDLLGYEIGDGYGWWVVGLLGLGDRRFVG